MERGGDKASRMKRKKRGGGHLLIVACSGRKNSERSPAPALHLYDGVNYRVLRKSLLARGWPPGLQIKILSAKYGLIDATTLIEPYELRLDKVKAAAIREKTLAELRKVQSPETVFVNLGEDYLPAVEGLERVFPQSKIIFAPGAIGMKMRAMKRWLEALPNRTAAVRGCSPKKRHYRYFFPDWDDFIYEPFRSKQDESTQGTKTYAHEACGNRIPFDGLLLSLAHIQVGKGALHRHSNGHDGRVRIRQRLRLPKDVLLFGDCGAFSYAAEAVPPFSPTQAAEFYHKFGFDIGASVDHIPLPEVVIRQPDGSVRKKPLSDATRYARMYLTRDNAEAFLNVCSRRDYGFTPLGVIQGLGTRTYVERLHDYLDMGYMHIALGGLVPRSDSEILEILCAVRDALQKRTRSLRKNIWLHLFGILRPKIQPYFKGLGVSSFDSASYFRKAWLRSDQNYLAPDGRQWYGTIRVPLSNSKAMQAAAKKEGLAPAQLATMERRCMDAIEACNNDPSAKGRVVSSINRYGPLLTRRGEENHFAEKHALLLKDRPWENCSCPFCKSAGMHVVVFRGANRNKRRGLHNTWVFYHKVLQGDAVPTSIGAEMD